CASRRCPLRCHFCLQVAEEGARPTLAFLCSAVPVVVLPPGAHLVGAKVALGGLLHRCELMDVLAPPGCHDHRVPPTSHLATISGCPLWTSTAGRHFSGLAIRSVGRSTLRAHTHRGGAIPPMGFLGYLVLSDARTDFEHRAHCDRGRC